MTKTRLQKKIIKLKWHLRCKLRWLKNTDFAKYIEKNKRWLVFAPAFFLTIQLWYQKGLTDRWRTNSERLNIANSYLISANVGRNLEMDDFNRIWYEKTLIDDSIRITGINQAAEEYLKLNRVKILGKTNYDIAPSYIAAEWNRVDSLVISDNKNISVKELFYFNDTLIEVMYSHKWRSKYIKNRMYGVSIPVKKIKKVIYKND